MTTYFVTRHQGAVDWAKEEGYASDEITVVTTLDPEKVQPGDLVIGTLPVHLAARITEKGGRYLHLAMNVPEAKRGVEMTANEMRSNGARLEELHVVRSEVVRKKGREVLQICIASEQALPSLIPTQVSDLKPSAVLILASKTMLPQAKRLKFGLKTAGISEGNIRIDETMPDHDVSEIVAYGNALIQRLHGDYPSFRWILNATGGNKLMSMGLIQVFRPYAEIIYCDTEHDHLEYIHPPGKHKIKLPVDLLNVQKYLAAQGFVMRDGPDPIQIRNKEDLVRKLADRASKLNDHFHELNKAAYEATRFKNGPFKPEQILSRTPNAGEAELISEYVKHGLLTSANGPRITFATPDAARFLSGGWLEEWCWIVGKELESQSGGPLLTRKRWGITVRIDPYEQSAQRQQPNTNPLNELDSVFVHRNRMLIIECKTGTQLADPEKSQDILNKLEALGEHAAGTFVTKWVLSARPLPGGQIQERAKRYRIRMLPPSDIPKLKDLLLNWMAGR